MTWLVLAMAMFKFRLRSPSRDHQTDDARFGRLQNFLEQMIAEIDRERKGLSARYDSATTDAAFLLEGEVSSESGRKRVDELTATVRGVERRMKELARQIDLLEQLSETGRTFQQSVAAVQGGPASP